MCCIIVLTWHVLYVAACWFWWLPNSFSNYFYAGVYIEEVLNKWKGDYEKLEHNHTYIQWLVTYYLFLFQSINLIKYPYTES